MLCVTSLGSIPMTNTRIRIVIRDQSGEDCTDKFSIGQPTIKGDISPDVTGNFTLAALKNGKLSWLMVPLNNAVPGKAPVIFNVAGTPPPLPHH